MQTRFELADVVYQFYTGLADKKKLTPLQTNVLGKIAACRTAALSGHEEVCENYGTVRYSYNSCGNRHCLPISGTHRLALRAAQSRIYCA